MGFLAISHVAVPFIGSSLSCSCLGVKTAEGLGPCEIKSAYEVQTMALSKHSAHELAMATAYGTPDGPNASWFKKQDASIATEHTESHQTINQSSSKEASINSEYDHSVS